MHYLKDRIAWLRSFFTASPVLTGRGFTTDDKSLKDLEVTGGRRPGTVRYASRVEHSFVLVGQVMVDGKIMYRIYDDMHDKEHLLDKELFQLLFRIQLEGNT